MPKPAKAAIVTIVVVLVGILCLSIIVAVANPRPDGRACFSVPDDVLRTLANGAGEGFTLVPIAGAAVDSGSRDDTVIVAMRFSDGQGEHIGVWGRVTLPQAEDSLTVAIDSTAQYYTVYPSERFGKKFTEAEDGVREARACLDTVPVR